MGRGCPTQQSDNSGGVGEVLLLRASPRVSLTIKLEPRSMQATFVLTNLPTCSPGRWLSGLGFLGRVCPNPFLSKEKEP